MTLDSIVTGCKDHTISMASSDFSSSLVLSLQTENESSFFHFQQDDKSSECSVFLFTAWHLQMQRLCHARSGTVMPWNILWSLRTEMFINCPFDTAKPPFSLPVETNHRQRPILLVFRSPKTSAQESGSGIVPASISKRKANDNLCLKGLKRCERETVPPVTNVSSSTK